MDIKKITIMKEILELRINYDYANLLFSSDEGKNIGTSVKIVEITKDDPRYFQIPVISKQVKEKYGKGFFFGWQLKRSYSKAELEAALLFHLKIKTVFEPAGEECGTVYDESVACEICGANRKQVGVLSLKKSSIPNKDIAHTIAGEVVVSEKFVKAFKRYGLRGLSLEPITLDKSISDYCQLIASSPELDLLQETLTGVDPFNFSESSEGGELSVSGHNIKLGKEIYKCPIGHTIGLNLLSEPCILNSPSIREFDFFSTKQKTGVKRGLLRPEPLYLCSKAFMKMVEDENLTGFNFEIANIR